MNFTQTTRIATTSDDRVADGSRSEPLSHPERAVAQRSEASHARGCGGEGWRGIASIDRAPSGRLLCVFYTGGPKEPAPENRVVLCWSDDAGATWTEPLTIAEKPGALACIDPCVWFDPAGRLVVQYTVYGHDFTEPLSLRETLRCDDPYAAEPRFDHLGVCCPEFGLVFPLNRPTLLGEGRLVLPMVPLQDPEEPGQGYFSRPQKLACAISDDGGESWRPSARVAAPDNWSNENMIVELRDGRLWMLARSRTGHLWQTFSDDRGETWAPVTASVIASASARFYIGRLASGRLMLIHNPGPQRDLMTVSLSDDDGATWPLSAELMRGGAIAYPDAVQVDASRSEPLSRPERAQAQRSEALHARGRGGEGRQDGVIHCVVDVDRKHIEYLAFTEEAITR